MFRLLYLLLIYFPATKMNDDFVLFGVEPDSARDTVNTSTCRDDSGDRKSLDIHGTWPVSAVTWGLGRLDCCNAITGRYALSIIPPSSPPSHSILFHWPL